MPPDQRLRVHQAEVLPLLERPQDLARNYAHQATGRSDIASVIHYALLLWAAPVRYAWDNTVAIDDNPVERAMRPVAPEPEKLAFAGYDAVGRCAAATYSLIGTAKVNGLDPEICPLYVIGCIADHPVNQATMLLPRTSASSRDEARPNTCQHAEAAIMAGC